ncbi:hypothetical protein GHT09_013717 [Marmota monax]|uniref:Uncharacterized protein n=2 Tax=Marmota monax TaxID=9995 RepID=A0A834UYU7_MARMO|nr:hypothetical protein GHT09_013717 [Marmota monax]
MSPHRRTPRPGLPATRLALLLWGEGLSLCMPVSARRVLSTALRALLGRLAGWLLGWTLGRGLPWEGWLCCCSVPGVGFSPRPPQGRAAAGGDRPAPGLVALGDRATALTLAFLPPLGRRHHGRVGGPAPLPALRRVSAAELDPGQPLLRRHTRPPQPVLTAAHCLQDM